MFMSDIRRATQKHRKALLVVIIILAVGVVGSFAVWGSSNVSNKGTKNTVDDQIAATQTAITNSITDTMDYTANKNVADLYMNLIGLYNQLTTAGEDATNAKVAAAAASAVQYYQAAIDTAPTELNNQGKADLYFSKAQASYYASDWAGTEACVLKVIDLNQKEDMAYSDYATLANYYSILPEIYSQMDGDVSAKTTTANQNAAKYYQLAIDNFPESGDAVSKAGLYINKAQIYISLGDMDKATSDYKAAVALAPKDWSINQQYTYFLLTSEGIDSALTFLKAFRAGMSDDDTNIEAVDSLISSLESAKDSSEESKADTTTDSSEDATKDTTKDTTE